MLASGNAAQNYFVSMIAIGPRGSRLRRAALGGGPGRLLPWRL